MQLYRNCKTNELYEVIDFCTNRTNANDGQKMVIYITIDTKDKYCKEVKEFLRKFKPEDGYDLRMHEPPQTDNKTSR